MARREGVGPGVSAVRRTAWALGLGASRHEIVNPGLIVAESIARELSMIGAASSLPLSDMRAATSHGGKLFINNARILARKKKERWSPTGGVGSSESLSRVLPFSSAKILHSFYMRIFLNG